MFDHIAHHLFVTQPGASAQGIADMGLDGILFVQYCRDPTLGIEGATFFHCRFGQHGDPGPVGQLQCQGKSCGTTADNDYIAVNLF